ncbi:hypothetical protein C8J56DRAFT_1040383 [Mycena floridula]|nr:hypothetical protein C8J56DRAFT_1040383 [Mycena floridula]
MELKDAKCPKTAIPSTSKQSAMLTLPSTFLMNLTLSEKTQKGHQIRSRLLDASQRLEAIVSQLTLDNSSATSPFSGFIININVCTDGHVNKGDVLCVILLFEFYKKGAVDLVSLDILAF